MLRCGLAWRMMDPRGRLSLPLRILRGSCRPCTIVEIGRVITNTWEIDIWALMNEVLGEKMVLHCWRTTDIDLTASLPPLVSLMQICVTSCSQSRTQKKQKGWPNKQNDCFYYFGINWKFVEIRKIKTEEKEHPLWYILPTLGYFQNALEWI